MAEPGKGMKGTVRMKQFLGKYVNYEVDFGTGEVAEVSADTNSMRKVYELDDVLEMGINTRRINIFDKKTETTLMDGVCSNV